jgi:flagellar assembly protein FliH
VSGNPEKPKLPAVIKAGQIIRGGTMLDTVHEIKPPPPVYPEGFIPPDEAHRMAQQILAEAAESAQRLQQQAQEMGYNDGYQAGFQAGQQAAVDSWTGLLNAFRAQIEGILAQRQNILNAAEPDIIRLVLMATAKIVQRESRHPDLARHVVAKTLPRASDGTVVRIRVSPADHSRLMSLPGAETGMASYDLVADPNIGAGGCFIECHLCSIDATFRTLFEEVAREIMRDEPERDAIIAQAIEDLRQHAPPQAPGSEKIVPKAVPDAEVLRDPLEPPDFELPPP